MELQLKHVLWQDLQIFPYWKVPSEQDILHLFLSSNKPGGQDLQKL